MAQSQEKSDRPAHGSNPGLSRLNEEQVTESNAIQIPKISLPKSGGALKGIDEKFQVNPSNGTASFSIPIPLSASREGFQPALQLAYNSGTGNSLFGTGWSMDLPAIQRSTERKIPRYKEGESDTFLISGAEDLVAILDAGQQPKIEIHGPYEIRSYRPRTEGLFAKIERVQRIGALSFYWKVTSKDNTVTFYGTDALSRIADPERPERIFKWLPVLSFDDRGNCLMYVYKPEDQAAVKPSLQEQNRLNGLARITNSHLKRIRYGNRSPYYPAYVHDPSDVEAIYKAAMPPDDFMFEIVFDYGEHPADQMAETELWKARKDAYSDYRAGFEVRTYRQCQRILMFHRFAELGPAPVLIRSLNLHYETPIAGTTQDAELSYLTKIIQTGYALDGKSKSLPPATFEYQPLHWNTAVNSVKPEDVANAPAGIGENYQWIDFWGEGVSGLLTEQAGAWHYKSNLGNGHFSPAHLISPKPSFTGIATGALSIQDLDSNGKKYIVSQVPDLQGYFEQTAENEWLPFKPFPAKANVNTSNPNVKFLDLNGDGIPELVISDERIFTWYPGKGTLGFDAPEFTTKPFDEEKGPAVVFGDSTHCIYLADMSGDGLTDIVRIKNESVCYWPNLGYGNFGPKVSMGNFKGFDHPDQFNPAYLHLFDVSGTGATDIVYLGKHKFKAYLNLSGNALSAPLEIDPFWDTTRPNQLSVADLLGNGTGCIVWSSPLAAYAQSPMQYIDLMGGMKPHLMVKQFNGMGKETTITYKSSAAFYLEDKKNKIPWATKLPFPVQCVQKVAVADLVSDVIFCSTYNYRHGYYDHPEREFRGFGLVEQQDTEAYQYLKNKKAANATDLVFHEPPTLTRTWYHTGAYLAQEEILSHFKKDYWYNDPLFKDQNISEITLPDTQIPDSLEIKELIAAHRACKGLLLRKEVFLLDGSDQEKIPYSVSANNCQVKLLQPKAENAHAVFIVHQSESVSYNYERNLNDPRISHSLHLEIDDFGNLLKSIAVVYGRKNEAVAAAIDLLDDSVKIHSDFIKTAQTQEHLIYTETKMTTDALEKENNKPLIYYRLPASHSVKTYEAAGFTKSQPWYQLHDFEGLLSGNVTFKGYDEALVPSIGINLRQIEETAALLVSYDLENPLPSGKHGALGINFESYQLAYTPELVEARFNQNADGTPLNEKRVTDEVLSSCKYLKMGTNWWIRSGTVHFFDPEKQETRATAAKRFYQPIAFTDPFNNTTKVTYPLNKTFLYTEKTIDVLGNESSITEFDYRTLAARTIKDSNDNLSQASYDALGMVAGMALLGKGAQADDLIDFEPDLTDTEISNFFSNPFAEGKHLLKNATSRSIYDYSTIPVKSASIIREVHVRKEDGTLNPSPPLQYAFEYTDGMGNAVLKKVRAEAGTALKVENGAITEVAADPRWVGNGRTILNNKGKPVKSYEPYFSTTHLYEAEPILREVGVTPVLHYDASGRMVRTLHPDGTISRMEYTSWTQKIFDQNDTVADADCKWRLQRENPDASFLQKLQVYHGDINKEKEALAKTLIHANTPTQLLTDSLGRPFFSIVHNKWEVIETLAPAQVFEAFYATRVILDVEGNTRQVIDARENSVMRYAYDLLGHRIHLQSMDSGNRWILNDSMGKPALVWDNRNYRFETIYDELHRPVRSKVSKSGQTITYDQLIYGTNKLKNENGAPIVHFDTAGVTRKLEIDFKGTVKKSSIQLCAKTTEFPDWDDLSPEILVSSARFDALGRTIETQSPHDPGNPLQKPSTCKPIYNEANLLNQVVVNVREAPDKLFVNHIEYDTKGQRSKIIYGNQTSTQYQYDPDTFRLRRLQTRSATGSLFQDLTYTYDPSGNVINIEDQAQQSFFFSNALIQPINNYRYDANYRLIEAKGREHIGQNQPCNAYDRNRMFRDQIPASDHALRNYTERYTYDPVGNLLEMKHTATGGSWTRQFINADLNNQLLRTKTGAVSEGPDYIYDAHGSLLNMPHLPAIQWNFQDRLQSIQTQAGAENDGSDGAVYTYDSGGQRMRKIVTKGDLQEERLYFNGFEIFRKRRGHVILLERESLHIVDDKSRIAMVESLIIAPPDNDEPATLCRFQYSNQLSSATLELNDAEIPAVISYEEYHPYGTTAYQNLNKELKAAAKRYRYTGMERDEESGLNYHGARYYASWLCRWTAADPIGIGDGVNVYAYCQGNPTGGSDPSGTECNGISTCKKEEPSSSQSIEDKDKASSVMGHNVDEMNAENEKGMAALKAGGPAPAFNADQWQQDVKKALTKTESPGYKAGFNLNLLQSRGLPENRTFWNRGGSGLATGIGVTVLGVGGIFTGGGTWVLLGAGMLTAGGIATTSVSAIQLGTSYGGKTTYAQDMEVNNVTSKTLMLSNPAALLGGVAVMPFYKNPEEGLEKGALAGSLFELGLPVVGRAAAFTYLKNPVKGFAPSLGMGAVMPMPMPIFRSAIEMRARDIQFRLYTSGTLNFVQATRFTSASVIDVGDAWIITHTNPKAWAALNSGQFYLKPYEVVGPAPMKLLGKTVHSEMLGRDFAIGTGYSSGLIGTYPSGCYGCQLNLRLNSPSFIHLNPRK